MSDEMFKNECFRAKNVFCHNQKYAFWSPNTKTVQQRFILELFKMAEQHLRLEI